MVNSHAGLNRWLRANPAPNFANRFALYDHIQATHIGDRPIAYLEFGVHRGESLKRWTEINRADRSLFVGFDTFTGLPTAWGKFLEKGHFDVGGEAPRIDETRASFVKGLFQDTLKGFLDTFDPEERMLVVHNDSDLYSSTHFTLASLNDRMVPGSILIFDEFASPLHEFRAWTDYAEAFMRKATLIGTAGPYAEQAAFRFD